jgi:hypothetical protein
MIERGRTTWIALALLLGCVPPHHPPTEHPILREWGLYVAHVEPRGCDGCEALARGDRIDRLDGQSIVTNLDALADRQPHVVEFWDASADARATTTITLKTVKEPPELADAPPIWSAFTDDLAATPSWARRRMFARVIPELLLIGEGDEPLTGLDLYGRSHVVVLFDWAASSDRQNGALCMQVLQKAQADLLAEGIEIVFAQVRHPSPTTKSHPKRAARSHHRRSTARPTRPTTTSRAASSRSTSTSTSARRQTSS